MKNKIAVIQKEGQEVVSAEVIAHSIKRISETAEAMNKAGLSKRAICLLVHDASGVGLREIEAVLLWLPKLKDQYCLPTQGAK